MSALADKVVLVTGGGRGIGRSVCLQLAALGARIVVNDLDDVPAAEVVAQIVDSGGSAIAVPGSVTAPDFPDEFIGRAVERYGDVHILVNNAGYIWNGPLHRMTDQQWDAIQDVHLRAPFRILRSMYRVVEAKVREESALGVCIRRKVVNVSSVAATGGSAGQTNYSAAKAGIIGLTRSLAKEWGRLNVNVNCVAFGLIETRLTQEAEQPIHIDIEGKSHAVGIKPDTLNRVRQQIALGRAGTAEEAAGGIVLLCLPQSDYITGQVIQIDGGMSN